MLCLLSSIAYAYETERQGKWQNNEPVRVKINWINETVKVNDVELNITGTTEGMSGIATSDFTNKLGQRGYFTIGNFGKYNHTGVFISQVFSGFFNDTVADTTLLTCTKGFNKPFKEMMTQPA